MARSELLAAQEEIGRLNSYISRCREHLQQICWAVILLTGQAALFWICGRDNLDAAIYGSFVVAGASHLLAKSAAKKIMP